MVRAATSLTSRMHVASMSRKAGQSSTMKSRNLILLVIVLLLLIVLLPTWPYSAGWGFYPSGGLGLVLLIVLILALAGRI